MGSNFFSINVVIDQTKPSGLATTKLRAEAEEADARVVLHVVHLGELLAELGLEWERVNGGEEGQRAPCESKTPSRRSRKTLKD